MSNHSSNNENDGNQLPNVDEAAGSEPISRHEGTSCVSDVSFNSSNASHKQLKSAHTIANKSDIYRWEEKSFCSASCSQYDSKEHYKHRLKEADQALSSRDSLIVILQEQLKKVENLYKKSLDDTQDFRFKYCIVTKECGNLKRICEKYRGDIALLTKSQGICNSNEEIINANKDADNRKLQYKEVPKKTELMEKNVIVQKAETTSRDTQVEFPENENLKQTMETFQDHYKKLEKTLHNQNDKLELLVEQLQEDLKKAENDRECLRKVLEILQNKLTTNIPESSATTSFDKVLKENETLKEQVNELTTKNQDLLVNQKASQLLYNQDLSATSDSFQMKELKDEIQFLKTEIQKLYEKNIELQKRINENNKIQTEELSEMLDSVIVEDTNITAKDSIIEILKQDKEEMRKEIDSLKYLRKLLIPNFKECICSKEGDNISTPKSVHIIRGTRDSSRVSFALTDSERMHLKEVNEIYEEKDTKSNLLEELNLEVDNLQGKLEQEVKEKESLTDNFNIMLEKKNEVIHELTSQNKLLKDDYKELLNKMNSDITVLETKIATDRSDNESIVKELEGKIQQLQKQLDSAHQDYKEMLQENNRITTSLTDKTSELNESKLDIQDLKKKLTQSQKILDELKEENIKYIQERSCYEEAQVKLNTLEKEVNEIPQLKHDNDLLAAKVEEMNQTVQQYKEVAEFKTMENEKLIKNEQHLECLLSRLMEEADHNTKEHQEELEKNKELAIKLTKECKNLQMCYKDIDSVNVEKQELLNLVHQKDDEIGKLKQKIEEITTELNNEKLVYERVENLNDRSFQEISCLFKTKENEISAIDDELKEHKIILEKLQEENNLLRQLIDKNRYLFNLDQTLLKEIMCAKENEKQNVRQLSENVNVKSAEDDNTENTPNKLLNIRMKLITLLQNLEYNLSQYKKDIETKRCGNPSTHTVDEMIGQIETFNKYLFYYDTSPVLQQAIDETVRDNDKTFTIKKSNEVNCALQCCNYSPDQNLKVLQLKREYLSKKIVSIDEKLRTCLCCESPSNSDTAIDIKELCFQRKYCSESIESIDKVIQTKKSYDSKDKENHSTDSSDSNILVNADACMNAIIDSLPKEVQHNGEEIQPVTENKINYFQEQLHAKSYVPEETFTCIDCECPSPPSTSSKTDVSKESTEEKCEKECKIEQNQLLADAFVQHKKEQTKEQHELLTEVSKTNIEERGEELHKHLFHTAKQSENSKYEESPAPAHCCSQRLVLPSKQPTPGTVVKHCRATTEVKPGTLKHKVGTGIPILIKGTQKNTTSAGCQTLTVKCNKPRWKHAYVQYHANRSSQKVCGKPKDEHLRTITAQQLDSYGTPHSNVVETRPQRSCKESKTDRCSCVKYDKVKQF